MICKSTRLNVYIKIKSGEFLCFLIRITTTSNTSYEISSTLRWNFQFMNLTEY